MWCVGGPSEYSGMWCVAGPSKYLAITGGSIKDVKLAKKAWIWPTQKCVEFPVLPVNYTIEVWAMSAEKLPFFLSAVFTIGPCVTHHESLLLYAKLIASHVKPSSHVKDLIQGLIKGQMLIASMTMEKVLEKLQLELKRFGLVIYKVNQLDASEANMNGKVGARQTKEKAVKFDVETKDKMKGKVGVGQTKRKVVTFDLETKDKMKGKVGAEQTKSPCAGQTKQNAVKTDLETKIVATDRLKVEIKVTWAVKIFKNQDAKKDAWSQSFELAKVQGAYARQQEDEGIQALAQAQGMYLAALLKQFGLFYGAMRDYLMINWGMFS